MKITWGTGIAIFYSVFALTMVGMVFKSRQYDNSLVSDEYYAEDLKYQQHYVKLMNSKALEQDVRIETAAAAQTVTLRFPATLANITGEIRFFRPSSGNQDLAIPIKLDEENNQKIAVEVLQKGLWKLKIDWSSAGKNYYKEENIVL